jgi:hypothetical protein
MQTVTAQTHASTAIRTDLGAIFVSLELSQSTWVVTSLSPGGGEKMSKHSLSHWFQERVERNAAARPIDRIKPFELRADRHAGLLAEIAVKESRGAAPSALSQQGVGTNRHKMPQAR